MALPQLILVSQKDSALTTTPADKMSSIKSEAELLQQDLESLRTETQRYLEEKHSDNTEYLPTIRNAIAFLPASTRVEQIPLFGWKQQTEISSAPSFSSVFAMFKRICKFPDSSLLEHLVRLFGNEEIQSQLLAYMEKLRGFRSRTKVSDFTKACTLDSTLPLEFSILTIKLGREWHRSTLEDIEQLRQSMIQKASLTSYGIRLLQVEWEQGLLHWCVPSRALQLLVGSLDSAFLQENHVELLSINGTHLQAAQTTGLAVPNSFSPSANVASTPVSGTSSKNGPGTLPISPPSATGGQTGQPLSLQDQLAMVGAQVVQFKPAVTSDAKQSSSSTVISHSSIHTPQPTPVQIIHPQGIPSTNGPAGINMGRVATVPVMQHPGSGQIQIIHPQIIQPGALHGSSGGGKHIVQQSPVIVRGKSEGESPKLADGKPSLTQDGFMVVQGGPNGNSLVLVPSYVMVNSSGRQKLASVSSPSSSSTTNAKPSSQGIATLLQPGTPVSPLFSVAQNTRGAMSGSPVLPIATSTSSIFTIAHPGQGKIYENPIVSVPNPAVSSSSPRSVSGTGPENSVIFDMNAGRPGAQLKSLNHICTVCGNGYMWASSLKRHMHTHMGENMDSSSIDMSHPPSDHLQEPPAKKAKTIECQICNQLLESPAAYTRHLRLHMKMHRRREHAREMERRQESSGEHAESVSESRGREEGGEEDEMEEEERGRREERVEGGEGEGEGKVGGGGQEGIKNDVETIQPKKEETCSSSSGSDHSSDSASDAEETMETSEPSHPSSTNSLPPSTSEGPTLQEPSTGTSQDAAGLPSTMATTGIPFNQLIQFVGNKDGGETAEEASGGEPDSSQTTMSRRFRCDECGRYLSSQAALSGHQQCMHNKQKPHICHICNKGFFQSHSLTVHLRSHSGEKPYSCIVCNKSFSQRSSLNIHIRTHSGERPYQCPYCSRGFSDSSTLAKHRRTHTGERPYQCRECGASFSQSGNLWRHMKQVHPSAAVTT